MDDTFELSILEVRVEGDPEDFVCSHSPGLAFKVVGENLVFEENKQFSQYALAALLPLLPAKQRATHVNDWMSTDNIIACPDPNCKALFRIVKIGISKHSHAETTKVPLTGN